MKEPRLTGSAQLSRPRPFNSKRTKNVHLSAYFAVPNPAIRKKNPKLLFLYLETFIIFAVSNKNFDYEIF